MTDNNQQRPIEVQKADMALSDMTTGGVLVRDQRKRFILVAIKGTVVTSRVQVRSMSRDSEEIPKLTTFGSQVLYPATESQAPTLAQRSKPGFDKVTLTSQEIIACVDYPRHMLKSQVEGPRFKNTLLAYLGQHVQGDLENLMINGDTTSTNTLLAMFNGMIAGATSNTYAAGAAALSTTILDTTTLTPPEQFDTQANMVFFTNKTARAAYRKELGGRGTDLGDKNQVGSSAVQYDDSPVIKVPRFPNNLGGGSNETAVLYCDPKQWIFAFHDEIETQSEYNIRERTWTVVLTMRVAQDYEHEPAVVKTTGVLGQ